MSLDKLAQLNKSDNIAADLDEETLIKIGNTVVEEFKIDDRSRAEWKSQLDKIMAIAKQTFEIKNTPWQNASNVKYPLITNAAIQFAARNLPEIVQSDKVVRFSILGDDVNGMYQKIANAIESHMSYQLLVETNQWEIVVDKLLHVLPIVGLAYSKVYYDPITQKNCVDICTPETIVVHNDVISLQKARRISHVIYLHKNDIISGINKGIYSKDILDHLGDPPNSTINNHNTTSTAPDPDALYEFIEQHRYLDLDEDDYQEPYIVTVHKQSSYPLRIKANWDMDKIIVEGDKLIQIPSVEYFTDWHFIPSPDGKFHSIGFGQLLFPINSSVNTLTNQLIDSGTLNNLQSGIIGRGIRIKGGALRPKMGEYIVAEASDGTALKDNVFPFPTKEPSNVLFQLLGLMIQAGEKLSAVTDILTGQEQAQNSPATTILALEEQGLKVFTSIQKRIFRALKCDLQKLFRLNKLYFNTNNQTYQQIQIDGIPLSQNDYIFADRFDICPVFDPDIATDIKRLMRAQAVLQLATQGLLQGQAVQEAVRLYLKELRIPDYELQKLLLPPPPPPPNPEMLKLQLEGNRDHVKANIEAGKLQIDEKRLAVDSLVKSAEAKLMESKSMLEIEKARNEANAHKANSIVNLLSKVDPEKGITADHVNTLIERHFK